MQEVVRFEEFVRLGVRDKDEVRPPEIEVIRKRSGVLCAVLARLELEVALAHGKGPKRQAASAKRGGDHVAKLSEELSQDFTDAERTLMEKPAGEWTGPERLSAWYKRESDFTLHLAIQCSYIDPRQQYKEAKLDPPTRRKVWPNTVLLSVWFPVGLTLDLDRRRAEILLWRALLARRQTSRRVRTLSMSRLPKVVSVAAEEGKRLGLFPTREGDISVYGRPFARLTSDQVDHVRTAMQARLRAHYWLAGYGADWDKLPDSCYS